MIGRLVGQFDRGTAEILAGAALAALILAWTTRRPRTATPSQEAGPNAPERYARRVATVSLLGLTMVALGVFLALTQRLASSLPLFAAGFGLWIRLIRANRHLRHTSPTLRRSVDLAASALNATLLGGVLTVGNLLALQYGGRPIDLTRERAFTLSSLTTAQLRSLARPLTLTVFHGRGPAARLQLERIRQLLDLYRRENPSRIRVEYLDQFLEPERYEALVEREPGVAVAPGGGILVEYGEGADASRLVVRNRDLFAFDPGPEAPAGSSGTGRFVSRFVGEDLLTSSILRLREGSKARVGFSVGHGEPIGPGTDATAQSLSIWLTRLRSTGVEVVELDLKRSPVSEDIEVVVVAAPQTPFLAEEADRLAEFARSGKPLLLMLDGATPTGLEPLLRSFRIELGQGVVLDPKNNYGGRPSVVLAPTGGPIPHPIVRPLGGRFVLAPNASPIQILPPQSVTLQPGAASVVPQALVLTGPDSWAETTPESMPNEPNRGEEATGPIPVAVAVSDQPVGPDEDPRPRMVVVSSRFAADDAFVERSPTNLDLLMNALSWLRGRPEQLGIAPSTHVALTLTVDPTLRGRLVAVPTVLAMVLIAGLGVATYLARRS